MNKNLMNQFHNQDELTDEAANPGTEPQVIYEEIELKEKFVFVFEIIKNNEHTILRQNSTGTKQRKLTIEKLVQMFKDIHGFDGPRLSLRKISTKYGISPITAGMYNNRILKMLKKNDFVKSLRG